MHVRCGRSPDGRIGGAKKKQTRHGARGAEMADARVVAEKKPTGGEFADKGFKRELVRGGAEWGEGETRGGAFRLAGDDQKFGLVGGAEPSDEFEPALKRPIFLR